MNIRSPQQAIKLGIGLVTEDRKQQGLVLDLDVSANVVLGNEGPLVRFGFLSSVRERDVVKETIRSLRIKAPSATSNVGTPSLFSGGGGDPVNASTMALASAFAVVSGATRVSGAAFDVAGAIVAAMVSAGGSRRTY